MDNSSFFIEALEQLRWINWHIANAEGADRRALEGARDELMETLQASVSKTE